MFLRPLSLNIRTALVMDDDSPVHNQRISMSHNKGILYIKPPQHCFAAHKSPREPLYITGTIYHVYYFGVFLFCMLTYNFSSRTKEFRKSPATYLFLRHDHILLCKIYDLFEKQCCLQNIFTITWESTQLLCKNADDNYANCQGISKRNICSPC